MYPFRKKCVLNVPNLTHYTQQAITFLFKGFDIIRMFYWFEKKPKNYIVLKISEKKYPTAAIIKFTK